MAPPKLSETDKKELTRLYCQPGETTSTLADKFDVSSSTVSRVLKQQLSEEDYAQLMQWKRSGERGELELSSFPIPDSKQSVAPDSEVDTSAEPEHSPEQETDDSNISADRESDADVKGDSEPRPEQEALPEVKTTVEVEPKPEAEQPTASDIEQTVEQDTDHSAEPTTSAETQQIATLETTQNIEPSAESETEEGVEPVTAKSQKAPPVLNRRSRRRSTSQAEEEDADNEQLPLQFEASESENPPVVPVSVTDTNVPNIDGDDRGEDISDIDIAADWDADDLDDEDYDEDYDDDDEEEIDDWDDGPEDDAPLTPRQEILEILPFANLSLRKPCYLVVDRLSELVTCPLKEFAELGLIPQEEESARTLPIFDNHRVARRFSRRNQRIVKVPNGVMLTKTQHYLHAKGITRILFDGQVYALN